MTKKSIDKLQKKIDDLHAAIMAYYEDGQYNNPELRIALDLYYDLVKKLADTGRVV